MEIALFSPMLESIQKERLSVDSNDSESTAAMPGFATALQQAVARVDGQEQAAQQKVAAVEQGESDNLVGAMLASQEASLSFSMMIQVRNKMMNAFDDIIKMQV